MLNVSDNINQVLGWVDRLSDQYEFAVAQALTQTVREVAAAMPDEMAGQLDRPTAFTRRGFGWERAEKRRLIATVLVRPVQAQYLSYQVYGGDRHPARKALKLPGDVQLDEAGNIRRSDLRKLIAEAKRTRASAARVRAGKGRYQGSASGLFYGVPANHPGMPAGIYRRVESATGRALQPLVLFPQQSAHYEPRFDFGGTASRLAAAKFSVALARAWARAKATAR